MWRDVPVSRDISPSMMNVSASRSCIMSSPPISFSYIARVRSRTSHAALKASSGSASYPSSPSLSPSPALSSASAPASAPGLDASANKSNAASPLHPPRLPRTTRSCCCHSSQALGVSVRHDTPWNWHFSRTVLLLLLPFLPRTKFCAAAFSKNAFPYAKYTSVVPVV